MMSIRTVTVELLRAGPRHNQLLSPLTVYLGICGDAPAGRVTLPYEHRDIEQRLAELDYRVTAENDPFRRERALERTGEEIAEILSLVPGLAGALTSQGERPNVLTHLRIVLSASELAMLPFELSKMPAGTGTSGGWLALQARTPLCITRHIRSVSAEGMRWPTDPRILFACGPQTPFDEHRAALERVLAPWRDAAGSVSDRLTVLERATIAEVEEAVAAAAHGGRPFSHVHILAHGVLLDPADRYSPIGVALTGQVVPGSRLAAALTAMTDAGVVRPAVVTLATCNSGQVGDVHTLAASVAHDLHDHGIPLVVASQFQLSVEGSLPFVERFYAGQLRGEHPLASLYDVRLLLHGRDDRHIHDWASLVVYEAFPADLVEQLEEVRYAQARRAHDGALRRLESLADEAASSPPEQRAERAGALADDAAAAGGQMPTEGPYALECGGLRAAGHKRTAQALLRIAVAPGMSEALRQRLLAEFMRRLDRSRTEYWRATKSFLAPASQLSRRKASLHWLLGQVLSLDVVLGRSLDQELWTAARLAALLDVENADESERAWAHASLSELALLRLADAALPAASRARFAADAVAQVAHIVESLGRGSEPVAATRRQFERYVTLWGNPELAPVFEALAIPSRPHWHNADGVVATARRIVERL